MKSKNFTRGEIGKAILDKFYHDIGAKECDKIKDVESGGTWI